jgi:hypothetical protein
MTLEQIAEWRGFTVRRSRAHPDRVWLIRDGVLFTRAAGMTEQAARTLLAPVPIHHP